MMANMLPHRNDIITPGASTIAMFKTIMTLNLRDSKLSQTERQVNAFIMSCLYPPFLLCLADVITRKKARRGTRHGRINTKCTKHEANLSTSKLIYFLRTKERKRKKMYKQNTKAVLKSLILHFFLLKGIFQNI